MPLNKYFKGKGESVMHSMQSRYGDKKGKGVFYGYVNKHPGMGPSEKTKKKHGVH